MKKLAIILSVFFTVLTTTNVFAIVVKFDDFSDTTGLTLNGAAQVVNTTLDGDVLRIVPATNSQSGSFFSSQTVQTSTFSTFFKFRITNPGGTLFDYNTVTGADGLCFVVQSISSDIGGAGSGIGYEGISNSVAVEFDTWHNSINNDPDSNHIGIDENGIVNHGAGAPFTYSGFLESTDRFDNSEIWYSWIDYNGANLEVRASRQNLRPSNALLSKTLNISTILGGVDEAYIGFTSGTGSDWGNHDIISWEYRDEYNPIDNTVPEPVTILMFLSGFFAIFGFKKYQR